MSPSNSAAWLVAKCARPLEVKPAPFPSPGPGEIVVKNGAVAINPVDWGKQALGDIIQGYIRYPFILGGDIAGEVVEVGVDVRRIRVGDRVLALALGGAPDVNNAAEGAFQEYTVAREHLAALIPHTISYEQACVVPLTLCTAAYGLFHKDYLALQPPTVPARTLDEDSEAIVITGGASSVGCNAIQLARSAGYRVYSTASPKNFNYLRQLGASYVFDYHNLTWVDDVIAELKSHNQALVGAYAIGNGSVEACLDLVSRYEGGNSSGKTRKFVAYAGFPMPDKLPSTRLGTAAFLGSTIWWMGSNAVKSQVKGVQTKFIDAKDLSNPENVVSRAVFRDFLPRALAAGQFRPAPEPLVVGKGLEKIQEAMDIQQEGVSAKKVVVSV